MEAQFKEKEINVGKTRENTTSLLAHKANGSLHCTATRMGINNIFGLLG